MWDLGKNPGTTVVKLSKAIVKIPAFLHVFDNSTIECPISYNEEILLFFLMTCVFIINKFASLSIVKSLSVSLISISKARFFIALNETALLIDF